MPISGTGALTSIITQLSFVVSLVALFCPPLTNLLPDTVQQMISYSWAAIRNKSSTQFAKAQGGRSNIQKAAVTWCVTLHDQFNLFQLWIAVGWECTHSIQFSRGSPRGTLYC
ncbi:hypothetical protein C8F04DRAFT_731788 [Mycena alexandri]|uniref:Uncharacterized protein n=1 Tax=Mycena alexandri TaxID=1745969 RepID=A0AAD6SM50_9AGAR|nr:hypothetical protein C8F04DRAFT_731788 [Mycena alexandri]